MLCVWLSVDYFGLKRIIHFHLQPYSPTFRNRKSYKRFSPLNRRRESVAFSPHIKLSSAKFFHASEILYLRSQTLRAARYGVLYEVKPIRHKCYFLYTQAVNRTYFSAQLAYGKMTFTNVSFMFGGINVQFCSKTYQNAPYRTKRHLQRRDMAQIKNYVNQTIVQKPAPSSSAEHLRAISRHSFRDNAKRGFLSFRRRTLLW